MAPQVVLTLTSTNDNTTQAVSTVKMPTINPPSFDGTADIEEFLKGYNLAAALNNWGAELKAQCLPIHIKGPAKTFYENNIEGKNTPWEGIEAILRRQFTPIGKEDLAEHKMRSRIQGQSETAEIYVQDKINLINKYDKSMAEAAKVRLVMYGLLPDILARVSPMEGNYTLEGLKSNIEKIELAIYRVNLRVNGIQDDAREKERPPNWASDLINVVKNIEEKSSKIVNNNNSLNDSFNREVQHLRNEMQDIKSATNDTQPGPAAWHGHQYTGPPQWQAHQQMGQSFNRYSRWNGEQREHREPIIQGPHQYQSRSRERNPRNYRGTSMPFERTTTGKLVTCFRCNNKGHIARFCPRKYKRYKRYTDYPVYTIGKYAMSAISVKVFERETTVLVDTGAGKSVASLDLIHTLPKVKWIEDSKNVTLRTAGGESLDIVGKVSIPIRIRGTVLPMDVYVIKNLVPEVLIGMDFISKYKAKLDFENGNLFLRTKTNSIHTKFIESKMYPNSNEYFLAGTYYYEKQSHRGIECREPKVRFSAHLETHCRIGDTKYIREPIENPKVQKSSLKKNGDKNLSHPVSQSQVREYKQYNNPVVDQQHPILQCNDTLTQSIRYNNKQCTDDYILQVDDIASRLALRSKIEEITTISTDINEKDKEKLLRMLCKYKNCMDAFSNDVGGNAKVEPIKIPLKDHNPVRKPAYRISLSERQIMKEIVEDLQEKGLVYPSNASYASPAILVRKNGKVRKTRKDLLTKEDWRLCVDYRKVNEHIESNAWPLERAEDIFASLGNSSVFITMDLKNGFFQLKLDESSQHVLSFITPDGLYSWRVLPFGANLAPNVFQKCMKEVFQDFSREDILIFMDDLVIHAKTVEELFNKFEKVMKRIEEANLKINLAKCQFLFKEIDLLGYKISNQGLKVSQTKVKAIVDFKAPKTVKQVRQFLGMSGFYRKFCKNYSNIAAPLTDLTKQDTKFVWTEKEQESFDKLKEMLISAPVLRHFREDLPTTLSTDASIEGIGAVLEQTDKEGKTHPVAYASRKLSPTERNYPNIKERDARNIEYDMSIKYKPGKNNLGPDFLSRNPVGAAPQNNDDESLPIYSIRDVDLPTMQREDNELSQLFKSIEHPHSVSQNEQRQARRYTIKDELLYKRGREPHLDLVMIPKVLQKKLTKEHHAQEVGGGHLGVRKTVEKLLTKYYWNNMEESVRECIKHCQHCQYRKNPNDKQKPGLLKPIEIEPEIFDRWGIDITGPLPTSNEGNTYIIAGCEYLSGYLVTKAVRNVTSEDVCDFLFDIVTRFGVMRHIVTDNGANLVSKSVNLFLEQIGCKRIAITGYHPQSNGVIESCFKSVKNMLALYVAPNQKDWDKHLQGLTFTLNSCIRISRDNSPFFIVHGVEANTPVEVNLLPGGTPSELDCRVARLRTVREMTAAFYNLGKTKQKELYDRHRKEVKYEEGDLVMMHSPRTFSGRSRKLICHWIGPFEIKKVFNGGLNYIIKDMRGPKEHKVHVARLKKYYPPLADN
ncbi:hypothetical protein WDU94_010736 [Cyamophila willieti]